MSTLQYIFDDFHRVMSSPLVQGLLYGWLVLENKRWGPIATAISLFFMAYTMNRDVWNADKHCKRALDWASLIWGVYKLLVLMRRKI